MGTSVDIAAASKAYRAEHPEGEINDIRLLSEGWDSVVYLANETLVLRFPKSLGAARGIATEIRLLPYLRDRVPLPIPQPSVVGAHPFERTSPFVGYACIGGAELTRERFRTLPSRTKDSIMQDLAAFLQALHAVDVGAARDCGVTGRDPRAEFNDVFARSTALVIPALEGRERATFVAWFEAILGDVTNFTETRTLIHGDMSPEHIFYDSGTQRICGIIDFGDAAIADPDYDLMYSPEDYGQPFVRALLRYYRHGDTEELFGKLEAFRLFDAARYTLFGHGRADAEMIRGGLTDLSELLRQRISRVSGGDS